MAQTGPLPTGSLPQGQVPPQPPFRGPRHRSFVGPILLIVLGVLFLILNFYPDFDPWPILARYWPVALIAIGVGKIWDSYHFRAHPGESAGYRTSGMGVVWLLLALFLIFAAWHHIWHHDYRWHSGPDTHSSWN
jgi:drug/metabolite transporter (DMT)-like permease